ARRMLRAISGGVPGPALDQRWMFRHPRAVVVFDLVVDAAHGVRALADRCADAFVLASSRINSLISLREKSAKTSAIQVSCSAAILRNSARPSFVNRMNCTRRSVSEVRRSR